MGPQVDPAIIQALGLDPDQAKMVSHGGGGFSSTFKVSGIVDGETKTFFVKTGSGKNSDIMFQGLILLSFIHQPSPETDNRF
jgi:hypothetical protein